MEINQNAPMVVSYAELKYIIQKELAAIGLNAVASPPAPQPQHDTLSLNGVMALMAEHGMPTSKAKIYKLTAACEIPHKKYGNKLVFSRAEILDWMNDQLVDIQKLSGRF